ncbi:MULTISPECIES: AI-2E family transporter [unclassified Sphingomonas]|uniref:AI-2E family transporter n=1 Tax=unclassified Sphingomonas TaxID=196159 RepID=UPI000BD404AA|nr:MAG: AI-2E family transporter [Sphingomonas sp. 32-62-10]OYY66039.1 MAG: AI-2E family transporter [Sphingomonas sp. 28-62-11]
MTVHTRSPLEQGFLLLIVIIASVAFAWLVGPFIGAILWGVIATILFAPLNKWLLKGIPKRPNLTATVTLLVIVAVVIIPAMLLSTALISEASTVYEKFQRGEIDLSRIFTEAEHNLPQVARDWLSVRGLTDFGAVQARIGQGIASSFQTLASQALNVGQSALGFFLSLGVMLYLTFFLLRDGDVLIAKIERCLPLAPEQRSLLVTRFVAVVRATIKGSVIVAILQGLIGGLIFWILGISGALLWGVAMGIFSLFPAIGTALIWVPASLYLIATGDTWQGGVLFVCGFFIISSVDNVVRPILVGREARMPDYLVLISTLGGFELMGFNGFVLGPVIAALFMAVWEIFAKAPVEAGGLGDPPAMLPVPPAP